MDTADTTGDAPVRIWTDADGCPAVVKDILLRAAERTRTPLILVANRALRVPRSPYVKAMQVDSGFDEADKRIVAEARQGDLVVTSDIPLAAEVIAKGAFVINYRGETYTADNIKERLAMRDLLDQLRGTGVVTGGPSSFSQGDRRAFANQLDAFLTKFRPSTQR